MAVRMREKIMVLELKRFDIDDAAVAFGPTDEDATTFWLDKPDWDDMGRPGLITLTIVPGDDLNS